MEIFDLEKAIREWRKNLFKDPGLEEPHIIELEEGLREEIEELVNEGLSEQEAFQRVVREVAPPEVLGTEFYKVRTSRRYGRPSWQAPRFMPALLWHYLKIALRKIRRQKSFSFINITGLSVGMACFLLILTSIQFELSYDRFHEISDRIYRVAIHSDSPDETGYSISTPEILSQSLKSSIPEVEQAGIIQRSRNAIFQSEAENFMEDGLFADENFFTLFSFEMIQGNRADALRAPNSIVLTEQMADKIFGSENPLGKSLHFKSRFLSCDLNVTGIVKQPPKNSHLKFDYLVSTASMAADQGLRNWFSDWDTYAFITYVELKDGQSPKIVEQKIEALIREARPQISMGEGAVYLQPVTDIHLKSQVTGATATNNRIQTIYLFGAIALLILLIAGINSMNLSTARATTRVQEISMRKVIGAKRTQLIIQFIGESYLFTALAMGLSLLVFHAFFPVFTDFLGNSLTLGEVEKTPLILSILGTILFVGAFSGIYPAFVLSAFQPFSLQKKYARSPLKGIRIRNLLVIFQFSAVVVLMIGTMVIAKQLRFIKNKNLGYERENVVILPLKEKETISKAQVLKTRLLEYPGILSVTVSDSTPLRLGAFVGGMPIKNEDSETAKIDLNLAGIDYDFLNVFGIKIAKGRNFSREFPSDSQGALVNEAYVRKVGWKDPLSEQFNDSPVIGVIKDFHFDTLHKAIGPAVFLLSKDFFWGRVNLGIRIRAGAPENTLAEIKKIFDQTTRGEPFDFYFLDDAYNELYRNEQRLAVMIGYLESLAIILGCMGLFGLATYAAQRRSKEIGIRKVLGASVFSIIRMLSREFVVLVVISNVIAWPLGYYFLQRWLQGYAYRCAFGIEIFVLAGLGTLLIALFAVGLHTAKAAWSNPLESIRYE
jgi:putative ABC transport system permease protein